MLSRNILNAVYYLVVILLLPTGVVGNNLHAFEDGSTSTLLTTSPGQVTTISMTLDAGSEIHSAHLNISTPNRLFPANVTIDVGGDDDVEYKFNGPDYGLFGLQNQFIGDDSIELTSHIEDGEGAVSGNSAFKMPKGARVRENMGLYLGVSAGHRISFPEPFKSPIVWSLASLAGGDANQDGDGEVLTATLSDSALLFPYSSNNRSFDQPKEFFCGKTDFRSSVVAMGDVNDDGYDDIVLGCTNPDEAAILIPYCQLHR